jgi:hypothetical protein
MYSGEYDACDVTLTECYLLRRPFKNIKLVGNEPKGLRTNFPKWRGATNQTKLYLIYHFTRTILLLKSLTTSDIDRISYRQYT